jgi:hypothetical protein
VASQGGKKIKTSKGASTFASSSDLAAAGVTARQISEQGGVVTQAQSDAIRAAQRSREEGTSFSSALASQIGDRPAQPLQGRALQRANAAARLPANAPGVGNSSGSALARQSSSTSLSAAVRQGTARSAQIASRPVTAPTAAGRAGQLASRGVALAREGTRSARAAINSPQGQAIRQRAAQDTQRVVQGVRRLGTAAARRAIEAARGKGRGFGRQGAIDVPARRVN